MVFLISLIFTKYFLIRFHIGKYYTIVCQPKIDTFLSPEKSIIIDYEKKYKNVCEVTEFKIFKSIYLSLMSFLLLFVFNGLYFFSY